MIHGNLQTAKVWQTLQAQLIQACLSDLALAVFLEDLWTTPGASLPEWATLFCERVQTHIIQPRFLLGYSLGGRLAFHALLQRPQLWQGAIIISADPGLPSKEARQQCLAKDIAWGNQFLQGNWEDLLHRWNTLPIFCDRPPPYPALEQEFSRTQIAQVFQNFSKGHQAELLPQLQQLKIPILFISGEEDQRYCQIGQTLAQHCPTLSHHTIPNAGHRVPWDNPEVFVPIVQQFLRSQSRV
jgi:2-succinyl-6-hydroxy-2,4-cyclohexadiene-1-carboxylate synthase